MPGKNENAKVIRFEDFELDLRSAELHRKGNQQPVRLPEQPFRILILLIERQGQVVAREEIRNLLWPDNTVVEFEHSINAAINRLRQTLGDSANEPHFIETLARRGYRWKVPTKWKREEQGEGLLRPGRGAQSASGSWLRQSLNSTYPLVTVLIVVAGLLLSLGTRNKKRPPISVVPATSMPGFEWGPTFSPDGREIAFVHADSWQKDGQIYVKALEDEKSTPLTTEPGHAVCPAWSPDGKLIAYTHLDDRGAAIFLVTPLGGARREFRHLSQNTCQSSWSPDSKSLAYGDTPPKETSGVFIGNLQLGTARRLTTAPPGSRDESPAFSPKGDQLAFLRSTSSTSDDLFVMSLSDHHIRRLTFLNAGIESPQWTVDGRRILFCLNPGVIGERSLFSIDAAGGELQRIPFISSDAGTPALSPRGDTLAYADAFIDSNIWKVPLPDEASGSTGQPIGQQELISSSRLEMQPQLSPDRSRLVYVSDRDGSVAIWTSAADGSNPVRLVAANGTGSPRWSPDGRFIVFDSVESGPRQVYVVSANGGAATQITNGESENEAGSWSSDGRWIYFASNRTGQWQVWKSSFQGIAAPVQVTMNGGGYAQESPDGRYVYYQKYAVDDDMIWRLPSAGGKEESVVDSDTWFWEVKAKGIYFIDDKPAPMLKFFRFETRRVETKARLKSEAWGGPGLTLSPDERFAYFTQMDNEGGDIMLIKNLQIP